MRKGEVKGFEGGDVSVSVEKFRLKVSGWVNGATLRR